MAKPTRFNFPHCTDAFLPDDPRMMVSKSEGGRIVTGSGARVLAEGASPDSASVRRSIIVVFSSIQGHAWTP